MGLDSLYNKIWALSAKWWWRFGEEQEALQRKIIALKYGVDKWGWWPRPCPRYRTSGIWGGIASFRDVSNVRGDLQSEGAGLWWEMGGM